MIRRSCGIINRGTDGAWNRFGRFDWFFVFFFGNNFSAAFFASVRQERAALEAVYGDPETVDLQIEALLRDQAARVCQMVGEVEPE